MPPRRSSRRPATRKTAHPRPASRPVLAAAGGPSLLDLPLLAWHCVGQSGQLTPADVFRLCAASSRLRLWRDELLALTPLAERLEAARAILSQMSRSKNRWLLPSSTAAALLHHASLEDVRSNYWQLLRLACEHGQRPFVEYILAHYALTKADVLCPKYGRRHHDNDNDNDNDDDMDDDDDDDDDEEYDPRSLFRTEDDKTAIWGYFPLQAACASGDVELVKLLIDKFQLTGEDFVGENGREATFRSACFHGHLAMVKFLWEQVDTVGQSGFEYDPCWSGAPLPPVYCACARGHLEVVQYLIKAQQLSAEDFRAGWLDSHDGPVSHVALKAAADGFHDELLLYLLKRFKMGYADVAALRHGDGFDDAWECAERNIAKIHDMIKSLKMTQAQIQADLREVCKVSDETIVEMMVEQLELNREDFLVGGGDSALAHLMKSGCVSLVQKLMAPPVGLQPKDLRGKRDAHLKAVLMSWSKERYLKDAMRDMLRFVVEQCDIAAGALRHLQAECGAFLCIAACELEVVKLLVAVADLPAECLLEEGKNSLVMAVIKYAAKDVLLYLLKEQRVTVADLKFHALSLCQAAIRSQHGIKERLQLLIDVCGFGLEEARLPWPEDEDEDEEEDEEEDEPVTAKTAPCGLLRAIVKKGYGPDLQYLLQRLAWTAHDLEQAQLDELVEAVPHQAIKTEMKAALKKKRAALTKATARAGSKPRGTRGKRA